MLNLFTMMNQIYSWLIKMDVFSSYIMKFLRQKAVIHIYSVPNFILEIFIAGFVCFLYTLLHREVTKIGRLNQYKTPRLICKRSLKVCSSKDSFCTSVTHIRHELSKLSSTTTQLKFKKYFNGDSLMVSSTATRNWDNAEINLIKRLELDDDDKRSNVIDKFISLTPAQYVKMEKERKVREKDLENCLKSLTTLYSNVLDNKLSQGTIGRQIQQAREELLFPQPVNKYLGFDTAALTKSLFDLLEKIVTESSIEKPLPFKGDFTTLAMDAGNFNMSAQPTRLLIDNTDKNEDNSISSSDLTACCTTSVTGKSSSHTSVIEGSKLIMT